MYKYSESQMILPDDFFLPFGGKLNKENRWVQLATLIPWWKVESHYAEQFQSTRAGHEALSVRVALGALIIQQRLNLSDRETVRQITENPYLQYFIGLPKFQEEPPFHPSLMTHFRKRLGDNAIHEVNEWIIIIGHLHAPLRDMEPKPRTYRENLRYCKSHGIRLSGPALGRPAKEEHKEQRRIARQDAAQRNAVEGKFGEGKRVYGLGLIRARLANTSATVIAMQLLVMNLEKRLRLLFCPVYCPLFCRSL